LLEFHFVRRIWILSISKFRDLPGTKRAFD
jgi:hypothetical protein